VQPGGRIADMKTPELTTYRRKLPHWRLHGSVYFVTWRLAKNQPPLHPEDRSLVVDAIRHFQGKRYEVLAYVVMDDHVHVLMRPFDDHSLAQILHSWKSFTANGLRRLQERPTPVWQDEYFDRIVRNDSDLMEKAQYILGNPVKRWPDTEDYPWLGFGP
jgi:putative transposase